MSWLFKKKYVSYTSDISCRHTRSTSCNQLYTPKPHCELFRKSFMYSGADIWNSLPLHVKQHLLSLYLNWKRLNDHWIISITTANLISMLYWFSQWFCCCFLLILSTHTSWVLNMTCMIWYWCPCKCIL